MDNTREGLERAIKHFKCERDGAIVVLDSGFGSKPGQSDLLYRKRKERAQIAIDAIEKQIPKKPVISSNDKEVPKTHRLGRLLQYHCPNCNNQLLVRYETDTLENGFSISMDYKHCSKCGQAINFGNLYRKIINNEELELED